MMISQIWLQGRTSRIRSNKKLDLPWEPSSIEYGRIKSTLNWGIARNDEQNYRAASMGFGESFGSHTVLACTKSYSAFLFFQIVICRLIVIVLYERLGVEAVTGQLVASRN